MCAHKFLCRSQPDILFSYLSFFHSLNSLIFSGASQREFVCKVRHWSATEVSGKGLILQQRLAYPCTCETLNGSSRGGGSISGKRESCGLPHTPRNNLATLARGLTGALLPSQENVGGVSGQTPEPMPFARARQHPPAPPCIAKCRKVEALARTTCAEGGGVTVIVTSNRYTKGGAKMVDMQALSIQTKKVGRPPSASAIAISCRDRGRHPVALPQSFVTSSPLRYDDDYDDDCDDDCDDDWGLR